jgi:hypothetical protein
MGFHDLLNSQATLLGAKHERGEAEWFGKLSGEERLSGNGFFLMQICAKNVLGDGLVTLGRSM